MLVAMKTSELFDQLLMIPVEEAIRVCAKGPNGEAYLKEVVDCILANRVCGAWRGLTSQWAMSVL